MAASFRDALFGRIEAALGAVEGLPTPRRFRSGQAFAPESIASGRLPFLAVRPGEPAVQTETQAGFAPGLKLVVEVDLALLARERDERDPVLADLAEKTLTALYGVGGPADGPWSMRVDSLSPGFPTKAPHASWGRRLVFQKPWPLEPAGATLGGAFLPGVALREVRTTPTAEAALSLSGARILTLREPAPRAFDLVGFADGTKLDSATLDALHAMSATPLAAYPLQAPGLSTVVRFRVEDAPPVAAARCDLWNGQATVPRFHSLIVKLEEVFP